MWIAVAKLAEMTPETARVVRAGGRELALACTPDGLFAMDNTCPHSGGPLGEGIVQGHTLTCPLHGWQFDCRTGKCLTEKRPNRRHYAVRIEKDQIWVEVPDPESKRPATASGPAGEWTAVAEAAELRPGTVRKAQAGDATIALICASDGLHAIENACAHEGGPLGEGSVDGTTVTCPWHGWKFDGKTGRCLTDSRYRQRVFETKIEQGRVWVRVVSTAAAAEAPSDPATNKSAAEVWKSAKHGIDVWPDVLRYAREKTPMSKIDEPDLERMKWYGYFYRKNNDNDHYMCRIRVPGCELTADQARAIAFIAYASGYSLVDVTTRGNIQIQGLTVDELPGVLDALEKTGLTARQSGHDNVRNITSHPYSGIDPEEIVDTRDLARRIQAMIIGSREFSDLPRKFNIALTGRPDPAAHAWTQDICYVGALGPDGTSGFQLLLGGNQGQAPRLAWPIPVFVRPGQVPAATAAILRTFRELGCRHNRHQVRFRYLIERIGPDGVLTEVEKRLGYELERFPKPVSAPSREEQFIGWFRQRQEGLWAVGVCVPVGRLTWDQFEGLAVTARRYGDGTLRTTYDQNLVLPGISASARSAVGYALARHGLTFEPDPVTRNMVACTGKQFCNLAVTETKGYAYRLIEELRRRKIQLHGIRIHMSGCPSSCAMSYTADIGLKGVKIRRGLRVLDAFDVYLGGGFDDSVQMGILYQKGVPFDQLPQFLEQAIGEFYLRRGDAETFSRYWRHRLREHKAAPVKEELPTWRCSRCGHDHVATDPPPFCPICAALRARFEPAPSEDPAEPGRAEEPAPLEAPGGGGSGLFTPSGVEGLPATNGGAGLLSRPQKRPGDSGESPLHGSGPDGPSHTAVGPWVCGSCGLKHAGEEPPELCPVCGVTKAEFRRGAAARVGAPSGRDAGGVGAGAAFASAAPKGRSHIKPAGRRILIVGGSVGGHTAARTARDLDPSAQITMVTDERYAFYNRLNLTRFLSEEVRRDDLFDYTPAWYEEQRVEVVTGTRVIGLDPIKKAVLLAEGRELAYDACLLAHGSSANTPPFYRADLPGVYLLRTLDDVDGIVARSRPGTQVAVIGGGVLGLEAAYGIAKRGARVRVFEYFPYLMPRQLDKAAGALFLDLVREKGIEPYVGVGVKEFVGSDRVEGLALADGRRFEAELVVVSTGIKPNVDWVKRSGVHCRRGVVVDDRMQTSAPDVYAAGDVVEWRGQVIGLWTNAIEQAKVAAANASGKTAFFQGFLPVTILKCLGIPLVSIGEIREDGDGIASKTTCDPKARIYRRVLFRSGMPIGGILLGTSSGMGEMRRLIEGGLELEKLRQKVVPDEAVAAVGT